MRAMLENFQDAISLGVNALIAVCGFVMTGVFFGGIIYDQARHALRRRRLYRSRTID
jgi:hypothetical protein